MRQYLNVLDDILRFGEYTDDRTGTGTQSYFGHQMRFDLRDGFPLITTKLMMVQSIISELLWFISGSTNVKDLQARGVNIWDPWADPETGELGPVYGKQWRNWNGQVESIPSAGVTNTGIDQLANVIEQIKTNPNSRRHIVSAWNVSDVDQMALPPCHLLFQFKVYGEHIDLQLYQRSADVFLGVPFNIASYALLLEMVAQVTGLKARYFIHVLGDVHIYNNHRDQVKLQLTREPLQLCRLKLNPDIMDIDGFNYDDVNFEDYLSHDKIGAKISK